MAESLSSRLGQESYPSNGEDTVLVEALAQRDPAVFDKWVEQHQASVARLARRLLGWPQDVDDVVQDVFLAAWKALPRFRGQSRVATWLTRITINKCRSHRRRQFLRLQWLMSPVARQVVSGGASADQDVMDQEKSEQIRRVVRALPTRYREVVVLRYLEEMPVDSIGQVLGLARNTVEVRLHRARERLRLDLGGLLEE
jgi:RNA polymerase sigma factor (sigma-70 family)